MSNLTDAYNAYAAAVAAHEAAHPFDLMTFLDVPPAPVQSAAARAGELLQGGIVYAMRHMLLVAAERPLTDFESQVATYIAIESTGV